MPKLEDVRLHYDWQELHPIRKERMRADKSVNEADGIKKVRQMEGLILNCKR